MSRVLLELNDDILARAERLALERGVTIEQLLTELIEQAGEPAETAVGQILGSFGDEPDLMDQVTEDAMRSREATPLRIQNG